MDEDSSSSDSESDPESDPSSQENLAQPRQPAMTETRPGKEREAPTIVQTMSALQDLKKMLKPPRNTGRGYKADPDINPFIQTRMEGMQTLLNFFTMKQSITCGAWIASSLQAAISVGRHGHCAEQLRKLC
jgi:hypothetical protein